MKNKKRINQNQKDQKDESKRNQKSIELPFCKLPTSNMFAVHITTLFNKNIFFYILGHLLVIFKVGFFYKKIFHLKKFSYKNSFNSSLL